MKKKRKKFSEKEMPKKLLRSQLKELLKELPLSQIQNESQAVTEKLLNSSWFQNSKRVAVFLNMRSEIHTNYFIEKVFESHPNVQLYTPRMVPRTKSQPKAQSQSGDVVHPVPSSLSKESVLGFIGMDFLRINSLEDFKSFPLDAWGIPTPTLTVTQNEVEKPRESAFYQFKNGTETELITHPFDLVLVPNVCVDRSFARLGHGKGYYDSFIRYLRAISTKFQSPPPRIGK